MRILGAAQDGGSTVSECFLAASAINPDDDESWYREWKKIADTSKERGEAAFRRGHTQTALANWLRATNYYRTAQVFLVADDIRHAGALAEMRWCSRRYLQLATDGGEVVETPGGDGEGPQGYFIPAPAESRPSPVVICFGGPDHFKEEYLHSLPRYAQDRGLSLLLIDLPGTQRDVRSGHAPCRYEIETAVSCWVDYLEEREDIDRQRIAIVGIGLGASLATRAASLDDRFAAAVCDGGIWDLHERAFVADRMSGRTSCSVARDLDKFCRGSIAQNIRCPILVTIGERDWLDAGHVTRCCQALREGGLDIDLRIFSATETAAAPAHIDNPTIGNEFIFDWLSDRLGTVCS
jgi:dienelactone hydrolase